MTDMATRNYLRLGDRPLQAVGTSFGRGSLQHGVCKDSMKTYRTPLNREGNPHKESQFCGLSDLGRVFHIPPSIEPPLPMAIDNSSLPIAPPLLPVPSSDSSSDSDTGSSGPSFPRVHNQNLESSYEASISSSTD